MQQTPSFSRPVWLLLTVLVFGFPSQPMAQPVSEANAPSLGDLDRALSGLTETVSPAVAQVFVTKYAPSLGAVSGGVDLFARQAGSGSGVIVDPAGYLITNAHVVEGAEQIKVLLADGAERSPGRSSILPPRGRTLDATLVGLDSETDLAVLKVEAIGLPVLGFADSDLLHPGQLVCAFGSPLGLRTSVTLGVVSGIARQLRPDDPMIYVQTDAAINPGNSGGPLVNLSGDIVGINTFILTQSGGDDGIGFAAPSNIVAHVYREIRAKGRVERGTIGVVAQTVTPSIAGAFGLPPEAGVILGDVQPDSPADKAGLQIGDVILSLDDKTMENGRQFDVNLYQRAPRNTVTLGILRNQANKTVRVTVEEREDDPFRFSDLVSLEKNLIPELGVLVVPLDARVKRLLPALRRTQGVLVAARSGGVAPWQIALVPGDVIYRINRTWIASLSDLRGAVADLGGAEFLVLHIERQGKLRYLSLDLE